MAKSKVAEKLIERHKKMVSERQPWLSQWQTIGKYVMIRKQNFTSKPTPGQFLTADVFDGTAPAAAHLCASTLLGALYPNGAKTFQLMPSKNIPAEILAKQEVKAYFEFCTQVMTDVLNEPKVNLYSILAEYMYDQVTFGISGVGVFERDDDDEFPIRFEAIDAKKMCIAEGKDGFVERVFLEMSMTVVQLVEEYGIDNVSKKVQKMYVEGDIDTKVSVLRIVEPRLTGSKAAFGNQSMPVASIHIEYDEAHELKQSGYGEMPIFISRFEKAMDEVYGRSPAFNTMSNILEANAVGELLIMAGEKILDPPLLVREDGTTEGGVIDTSARAVNVRHVNGRIESNSRAVETLVTIGDIRPFKERQSELREIIKDDFFIDRLVDLDNSQRMTAYETGLRNELRSQSLGSVYSRQIAEMFSPLIRRTFNILFSRGRLGVVADSEDFHALQEAGENPYVIPDELLRFMVSGKKFYDIRFVSPAARIMRYEELKGVSELIQDAVNVSTLNPEAMDVIDFDEVIRESQDLRGAPSTVIRSAEEVLKLRQGRAQAQQQQAAQQAALVQAETAKKGAQAAQAATKAGIPLEALGGVA